MNNRSRDQESTPFEESPGCLFGAHFRLLDPIGSGPVHRTYRARDERDDSIVCLKIPRKKFRNNDGFASRYRRDLLELTNYRHPAWVVPVELAEHNRTPFQVLPFIEGLPLPDWFEQIQRDDQRLLTVVVRTLTALNDLYSTAGRIHGSIKPTNLWVGANDQPLLLDLAATGRLEDHFAEKAKSGRPIYCSPEQLSGERADPRSDLYCLGLVLYRALSRRHPYFRDHPESPNASPEHLLTSLLDQLRTHPTPPSSYREDVPRWADRFLVRLLQPDPDQRFESFRDALAWLKVHTLPEAESELDRRPLPPVGRNQEMRYLTDRLDTVIEEQQGQVVRLHGALGCGKTRCLEWLSELARSRDVPTFIVSPTAESGLHLQSVLSELSHTHPDIDSGVYPVVESLLSVVLDSPTILAIKDIQQADDTLVEFLKELVSVLSDVPLYLILVEEDGVFGSESMREFVGTLTQSLELKPLDRLAIANLIEELAWTVPSQSVAAWVHKVSQGNPLHATLLVEFLQRSGFLDEGLELNWKSSPPTDRPTLDETVSRKFKALPPATYTILECAAVLGNPFRLSTLQAINYRGEDRIDQALSQGVDRGLLALDGRPSTSYIWKHPHFRELLLARIHPRRKQRIHRLAAAFYSRSAPDPARVAYHFLQAGDTPELFFWGAKAVEQTAAQKRRGECNYWMNVCLNRIPESEWLGPDINELRSDVNRDLALLADLASWSPWLRTLSGRPPEPNDPEDPMLEAQRLLSSGIELDEWNRRVSSVLTELGPSTPSDPLEFKKARRLLEREWELRNPGGEPFPT